MNKEIEILNELIKYCDKRKKEISEKISYEYYSKIAQSFQNEIEKITQKPPVDNSLQL